MVSRVPCTVTRHRTPLITTQYQADLPHPSSVMKDWLSWDHLDRTSSDVPSRLDRGYISGSRVAHGRRTWLTGLKPQERRLDSRAGNTPRLRRLQLQLHLITTTYVPVNMATASPTPLGAGSHFVFMGRRTSARQALRRPSSRQELSPQRLKPNASTQTPRQLASSKEPFATLILDPQRQLGRRDPGACVSRRDSLSGRVRRIARRGGERADAGNKE